MPIGRISQQTNDDCLPCCIAMVLNETREVILSWFKDREYNDIPTMFEVLGSRGYSVEEFKTVGEAGAVLRIVALVKINEDIEGHAVVMDEDHYIVDPRSKATTNKTLLDYSFSYIPQRIFVITKKEV